MRSLRTVRASLLVSFACLGLSVVAGCTEEGPDRPRADGGVPGTDSGMTTTACSVGGPARLCLGNQEIACNPDGSEAGRRNCPDLGQVCSPERGCTVCIPGRTTCEGNDVRRCLADGSGYETVATCDPSTGQSCNATVGACTNPCADAAASNSYIGCEYWPVTASNDVSTEFAFAVVVSNPQSSAATVTVTRGGSNVATRTVAPGAIESIELPWVDALKDSAGGSRLLRGGAYRLTSTLPVTVYQFNPLEYRIARDCPDENPLDPSSSDGQCFSFSNDASLLLPTHVLTPNYVVTTRPTFMLERASLGSSTISSSPGYFTVTAVESGTTTVDITFRANVLAGTDGSVTAFAPGSTGQFTLSQGDVLQILSAAPATCTRQGSDASGFTTYHYCRVGAEYDLTGSEVRASQRVSVGAGHNCAFVPFNRWACDHLEEQLFPEEAWGNDAFVSVTQPLRSEPNLVRIISGRDGNMLTFDPPSAHPATTLNRGQVLEFEALNSFRVQGTEAIQVAQFLVSQDYAGIGTSGMGGQGDPSMSLAIPSDQFRTSYAFLAPTTYTQSYVNVTAPMGATITLDGAPVAGFGPVGSTGYGVARVPVTGGAHQIDGTEAFGIVVYGFGSYTSYMYPGGLDLEEINVPF